MQLIAHHPEARSTLDTPASTAGVAVGPGAERVFRGLQGDPPVWASHGDHASDAPGFRLIATSGNSPIAAFTNDQGIIGIQFHPEVVHTPRGREVLRNFLFGVCQCTPSWTAGSFVAKATELIRNQVGDGRVICALSGGVDSAVAATLVHRAVGDQLTCVFVNNGLLRKEEPERVLDVMHGNLDMNIRYVDATDRFLNALGGVIDPEQKRRIVGREFISVFEAEASSLGRLDFLAQGTLYPDVTNPPRPTWRRPRRRSRRTTTSALASRPAVPAIEPLRFLQDEARGRDRARNA